MGSHSGYLSIFRPSATETDDENDEFSIVAARPTDLLLEQKLPNPIIGISSGRFMYCAGPQNNTLSRNNFQIILQIHYDRSYAAGNFASDENCRVRSTGDGRCC